MVDRQNYESEEERDDPQLEDVEDQDVETDGEDVGDDSGGSDDAEIEARARAQGWVPEDEWDADRAEREGRRRPKQFVTAREYLNRADSSMPLLRDQVRKLTDQVVEQKQLLTNMTDFISQQRAANEKAVAAAFERGIATAREEQRKAVEEGDLEAFDKAQKKIDTLEQQREQRRREVEQAQQQEQPQQQDTQQRPQTQPQPNPAIKAWIAQNPWFETDVVLHRAARDEDDILLAEQPDLPIADRLDEVKARVQRRYPERFPGARQPKPGQQRRIGPASVATPSGARPGVRSGGSVETQFAALPAEAKASYERYRQQFKAASGVDYTKEEYLKDYHSV